MTVSSDSIASSTETKHHRRQIAYITFATCLVFWVFVFADSGWGPLLTPLSTRLHISLTTTGLLYVVWSTGYLPGALLGGTMLDRYGPRIVFFGASIIVLLGMIAIYFGLILPHATPILALLIIAGLAGIGGGVIDASTNGLISGIFASKRGMALNLFNLLYPLGGVLIALIDAALLTYFHNDPLPPFLFTICFILAVLFSLLFMPKRSVVEDEETHTVETSLASTIIAGSQGRRFALMFVLMPVIIAMTFTSGISSSVRAWTPAYLHVAYGQAPALAAGLSSLTWALAALSRLGAAALIVRIGSWRMVMLGIGLSLIGFVTMLLSPNVLLGTLAIALTSVGLSPIFATFLAIGSERAGRSLGAVAGILLFTSGISTVFCGWFFGYLLNSAGPRWAVLFCMLFVVCGGLLAMRLRPTQLASGNSQ